MIISSDNSNPGNIPSYICSSIEKVIEDVRKSNDFSSVSKAKIMIVVLQILNPHEGHITAGAEAQKSHIYDKILPIEDLTVDRLVSDTLSKIKTQAPYALDKVMVRIQLFEKETPLSKIYGSLMDFAPPNDSPRTTQNNCIIL